MPEATRQGKVEQGVEAERDPVAAYGGCISHQSYIVSLPPRLETYMRNDLTGFVEVEGEVQVDRSVGI